MNDLAADPFNPNCPSRLKITRIGKRGFSHAETTAVPLPKDPT